MAKENLEIRVGKIILQPNRYLVAKELIITYMPTTGLLSISDEREWSDEIELSIADIPLLVDFLNQCLNGDFDES